MQWMVDVTCLYTQNPGRGSMSDLAISRQQTKSLDPPGVILLPLWKPKV